MGIRPLALIGMMGSGKSTVAQLVADHCGCGWYDLDRLIEQRLGRSIAAVFQDMGEMGFRAVESRALVDLVTSASGLYVLATGGGTPLDRTNFDLLLAQFSVVWLDGSADVLFERAFDPARPLTAGGKDVFQQLAQNRMSTYCALAQLRVDVGQTTAVDAAEHISHWWKEQMHD